MTEISSAGHLSKKEMQAANVVKERENQPWRQRIARDALRLGRPLGLALVAILATSCDTKPTVTPTRPALVGTVTPTSEAKNWVGERIRENAELEEILTGQNEKILSRFEYNQWMIKTGINPMDIRDFKLIYSGNYGGFSGRVAAGEGVNVRHWPDRELGVPLEIKSYQKPVRFSNMVWFKGNIWGCDKAPLKEDPQTKRWECVAIKDKGEMLIEMEGPSPFEVVASATLPARK